MACVNGRKHINLIAGPGIRVVKTKGGTPNPKPFWKTRKEQKAKTERRKEKEKHSRDRSRTRAWNKEKVEHYSEVGQRHCLLWTSV